jgi:hypothetical protein
MAQEYINIGSTANDGTGDPLRVAFDKINNNFTQLYSTGYTTMESITFGTDLQEIFSYPVNAFTEGTFQIKSYNPNTQDSINITIISGLSNDSSIVKFTASGLLSFGDYVTSYDMAVVDGDVKLYAIPQVDDQLNHFISYQILFNDAVPGMIIELQQGDFLGTENLQTITTEQAA